MKQLLALLLSFVIVFLLTACSGSNIASVNNSPTPDATENHSNFDEKSLKFVLTAGEAGEYGKLITYNKNTEFEETFYAFYIPKGTYTVTNKGQYMSQVNVYSDETHFTEEGWEEVVEVFDVKLLDVGKSATITVDAGQHIEIAEPSVFEFVQQ